MRRHSKQAGFGLVEAMLAVAVLSVALLGLARLQVASLQANTNAYIESQAALLAQDMFERIRANPAGTYTTAVGSGLPAGSASCEGTGANCTSADIAEYDLIYWKCALGAWSAQTLCTNRAIVGRLPSGDGSITLAAGVYTISIQWFDPADNANRSIDFMATI